MHFTIGTTRFTVSFLFCCVLALLILFDNNVLLYSFLMVCAHESAHLLAMYCCAVKVEAVRLEPFGIIIEKRDEDISLKAQAVIAAAGCVINFVLAGLFLWLYCFFKSEVTFTLFCVNVPAATQGFSLYMSAQSSLSLFFIPAHRLPARNPFAAVIPPSIIFMCFSP